MAQPKEHEERESEVLCFRKSLSNRKKVQTAEGWRRTMLQMRDERRKQVKAESKKS